MDSRLTWVRFVGVAISGILVLDLAASVAAQATPGKPNAPAPPARDLRHAFGVNEADGVLWGGADGFKVRFGADAVEFTPALGRAADHDFLFAWSTLSVGRGAQEQPVAAVAPRRAGASAVEYDRPSGVTERHEVSAEGLELSFVFASPPAGSGDLVVRLGLSTDFPVQAGDGGLRCEQPGVGGVACGAVTGIDAEGRRCQGAMRLNGNILELSLPASFVETASYPLVLDPFVYPIFPLAVDPNFVEGAPDVAYEGSGDRYLVVWAKVYAACDTDIRGQIFDAAGVADPSGYWFFETASDTKAINHRVASLSSSSRFMVVWEQGATPCAVSPQDIYGRSLSTAGLGMSAIIPIAVGGGANHFDPDVGGHGEPGVDVVSVIWVEDTGSLLSDNIIRHRAVSVPYQGDPSPLPSIATLGMNYVEHPSISKGSGTSHWHLVVFERLTTVPPPPDTQHHLEATLIDAQGGIVWGPATIVGDLGFDETEPDVDGDGTVFFTAFTRRGVFSSLSTVHCARTVLGSGGFSTTVTTIDDSTASGLWAGNPSVAFTGNGALVAWSKQYAGSDTDIAVVGLDPWSNVIADPLAFADYDTTTAVGPEVASRYSGDQAEGDGVMCAWYLWDMAGGTFDQDVLAAVVDPELGIVLDWGGATALGGKASVSAATVGNSGFTHFYDGLYGFNSVTLAVGVAPVFAPFCTGTLIPSPIFFLPLATGADSTIVLPTPLPPDPTLLGLTIWEQYAESDPFTPPCGKNLQLSNGLSITIQ